MERDRREIIRYDPLSKPRLTDIVNLFSAIEAGSLRNTADDALGLYFRSFLTDYQDKAGVADALLRLSACLRNGLCKARKQATYLTTMRIDDWPTWVGQEATLNICLGLVDKCEATRERSAQAIHPCKIPNGDVSSVAYRALLAAKELTRDYGKGGGSHLPWRRTARQQFSKCTAAVEDRYSLDCQCC
jgi:hypothetical protein